MDIYMILALTAMAAGVIVMLFSKKICRVFCKKAVNKRTVFFVKYGGATLILVGIAGALAQIFTVGM